MNGAAATRGPSVTIGMPAYNGQRYISRALESLLAQTYTDFELVISDNCSTDATLSICREYATRDDRIAVVSRDRNIGAWPNFRYLSQRARGEYFMWAAVDDYWEPDFLSTMVCELEANRDAGVAMCAVRRVRQSGETYDIVRFTGADDPCCKSHYELAKAVTSPKKYNLFIYGLLRTNLAREAIAFVPEVPGLDRLFVCQLALASRFRYVDTVLHERLHHDRPSTVRLPDEKFNRMDRQDPLKETKILLQFSKMILVSPLVPRRRKMYIPVILWRYGRILLYARIAPRLKRALPPARWEQLKRVLVHLRLR